MTNYPFFFYAFPQVRFLLMTEKAGQKQHAVPSLLVAY